MHKENNMHVEDKFWSAFGYLEGEVAPIDYEDIVSHGMFTEEEIKELIDLDLVTADN